ncbi:MAG: leucine-rich repeat domain-containing protein [Defluviitaleaceae bacterium]|nr:leucine-rich repeat domain-containing protein [Defluviitaleaceae bacterium]
MKKLLSILALMLAVGAFATISLQAQVQQDISVTIDGVAVDFEGQPPIIVDGRTLVPVRGVFEALGFDVDWDQDAQMVTLTRDDFVIRIVIGEQTFGIDDYVRQATGNGWLDVPAQIIGDRTLLPIRALVEGVGYYVDWDNATRTVIVSSTPIGEVTTQDFITIRGEHFSTGLTVLDLFDMDLQNEDIVVLRYMTNLTELWLSTNEISDISPLAELANLTMLSLAWNEISDLTPLAGLTNLTMLNLGGNEISDLTPLVGLANVTELFLHSNEISDATPLAGLVGLNTLWLSGNQISNLAPLAGLVNLVELDLHYNQISNLAPLAGLVNLQELVISFNQISDISPLASLTNLTRLLIWNNQISDITPLTYLEALAILNLWDNQISNISPLANLAYSASLMLNGNPITDWSPIEHVEDVDGRP